MVLFAQLLASDLIESVCRPRIHRSVFRPRHLLRISVHQPARRVDEGSGSVCSRSLEQVLRHAHVLIVALKFLDGSLDAGHVYDRVRTLQERHEARFAVVGLRPAYVIPAFAGLLPAAQRKYGYIAVTPGKFKQGASYHSARAGNDYLSHKSTALSLHCRRSSAAFLSCQAAARPSTRLLP